MPDFEEIFTGIFDFIMWFINQIKDLVAAVSGKETTTEKDDDATANSDSTDTTAVEA